MTADTRHGRADFWRRMRGRAWYWSPFTLMVLVLVVLVVVPMGSLLYATIIDVPPHDGSGKMPQFTLQNYVKVFSRDLDAIGNTLVLGVGGTVCALLISAPLAWLVARTNLPLRSWARVIGIMPLFFSSLVGAIAWSLIASPTQGHLNILLRSLGIPFVIDIYSIPGMIFVFGLYYAPYGFMLIYGALALMNPELEEAALVHGASGPRTIWSISFKLVAPAVLGAATLVSALVMENFPIPSILGTPSQISTLPQRIYQQMSLIPTRPNEAAANGVILLVLLLVLISFQRRLLARREYVTVTGKGFKPRLVDIGRWRWPAFVMVAIYGVLAVVLPMIALCIGAFRPNPYVPNFGALFDVSGYNLSAFQYVFKLEGFRIGMINSVVVAFGTAAIGIALYLLLAIIVHRTKYPGRNALAYVAMWPVAVPALVIGLGFLWTWLGIPLIYGTIAILVLAFVAHFFPQGYQGASSTVIQVHRDLEESARVAGASRLTAVRRVLAPLMRAGLVSTFLLIFILAMREFSIAIFLYTTRSQVVSITIWNQWEGGGFPPVAAMSLLYMLLLFGVAALCSRWLRVQGTN